MRLNLKAIEAARSAAELEDMLERAYEDEEEVDFADAHAYACAFARLYGVEEPTPLEFMMLLEMRRYRQGEGGSVH